MKRTKNSALWWLAGTMGLAMIAMLGSAPAWAQGEKRSVFTERDFHWQGHLKAGQTLEIINRNGGIDASAASGDEVQASGTWRGGGDEREPFVEVVEYPDGVTICAVYARDKS